MSGRCRHEARLARRRVRGGVAQDWKCLGCGAWLTNAQVKRIERTERARRAQLGGDMGAAPLEARKCEHANIGPDRHDGELRWHCFGCGAKLDEGEAANAKHAANVARLGVENRAARFAVEVVNLTEDAGRVGIDLPDVARMFFAALVKL